MVLMNLAVDGGLRLLMLVPMDTLLLHGGCYLLVDGGVMFASLVPMGVDMTSVQMFPTPEDEVSAEIRTEIGYSDEKWGIEVKEADTLRLHVFNEGGKRGRIRSGLRGVSSARANTHMKSLTAAFALSMMID